MGYIIQQPNSLTNPSNKYRVVDYMDWTVLASGLANGRSIEAAGEFKTYPEAEKLRDQLNAKVTV